MTKIARSHALFALSPDGGWIQDGDTTIWLDGYDPLLEEDIVQKQAELEYQEEVNEYQRQRAAKYPSYADQFDQIYHEGVDAWKASIQEVKDKYPKVIMDADELQSRKDKAIFDLQTQRYIKATERLSQYVLLEGREEVRESIVVETKEVFNEESGKFETNEITEEVITQTAIEPLEEFVEVTTTNPETMESVTETVRNPLVVQDEEEREAAQLIVDNTPQEVIDSLSTLDN
jgi:hypothetical protein